MISLTYFVVLSLGKNHNEFIHEKCIIYIRNMNLVFELLS